MRLRAAAVMGLGVALMWPSGTEARRACPTETVAESDQVVAYRSHDQELEFCIRSTGARRVLPYGFGFQSIYPGFTLNGRILAVASLEEGSGTEPLYPYATSWDLAPRTPRLLVTSEFGDDVGSIAAGPRGDLLFAQCLDDGGGDAFADRWPDCLRPGKATLVFAARRRGRPRFPSDFNPNRVIAANPRIDPRSVRWRRGRFEWREGDRTRTFRP